MNKYIITLSGGSTTGKTTISKSISEKYGFEMFKPKTTRGIRLNEFYSDYRHISEEEFLAEIKNDNFIFWDYLFGNYYGIPKDIEHFLNVNSKCLFIIPSWRMEDLVKKFDINYLSFHLISTSSKDIVINRMKDRGKLNSSELGNRIKDIKKQNEAVIPNAICIEDNLSMNEIFKIINKNIEKMLNGDK